MFRWWRRWFSRKLCAGASAAKKPRYQPRMEALEDRTTPAPLMSTAATAGLVDFSGVPEPADAAPTNSIDQALVDLPSSARSESASGLSAFVNLEVEVLAKPAGSVAGAFDTLTSEVFANLSPWGNAAALLEPAPTTVLPQRDSAAIFSVLPTALRGVGEPYSMPSSGSGRADSGLTDARQKSSSSSETPWGGSLTLWADSHSAAAITGTVFHDQNGNTVRDAGELPMTGVKVVLESKKDRAFLTVSTTVTDANGRYTFSSLPPANYRVRPEAPVGYRLTQEPRSVSLKPSTQSSGQDFGVAPTTERDSRKPAPTERRGAAPDQSSLLDRVFQALGGSGPMHNSLVDEVFKESPWPPEVDATPRTSAAAETALLVAAVAAASEFRLFPSRRAEDEAGAKQAPV